MQEITYSREIADMISNFLTKTRCSFSFDDQRGRFRFSVNLSGKIKKADYTIDIRNNRYTVYAVPSIYVNAYNRETMSAMTEFICRANHGLVNGNFELDMTNGEVRYKCFVNFDDIALTTETVENSICVPGGMLNRYGDGIADIIFHHAAAEEAFVRCKRPPAKESDRQIPKWTNDDGEEYNRMIARLRERLGVSEDEVAKKAVWDAEVPKHIKIDLFGVKGGIIS